VSLVTLIKISVSLVLLLITLLNARILTVLLEKLLLITNKWNLQTSHFSTSRLHSSNKSDHELVCVVPRLPYASRSGINSSIVEVMIIMWQTKGHLCEVIFYETD